MSPHARALTWSSLAATLFLLTPPAATAESTAEHRAPFEPGGQVINVHDEPALQRGTQAIATAAPGDARTVAFQWKRATDALLGGGWRWLLDWRLAAPVLLLAAGVVTLLRARRPAPTD